MIAKGGRDEDRRGLAALGVRVSAREKREVRLKIDAPTKPPRGTIHEGFGGRLSF